MNLKQAASELNINYSTAKTIVQTFRQEHRISKISKKASITKRGLKRELRLIRALKKSKIRRLMSHIISMEISDTDNDLNPKTMKIAHDESIDMDLLNRSTIIKTFSRIMSSDQLMLPSMEEMGPREGYISQGTITEDRELIRKKDIFQIKENLEEEYKKSLDYKDLIITRAKPNSKEEIEVIEKLPSFHNEVSPNPLQIMPIFSFAEYESKIMSNYIFKYCV